MAVSTIQSDLEIYGNIQSQGDVVISGSIKGNVAAKAVDVKHFQLPRAARPHCDRYIQSQRRYRPAAAVGAA